MAEFTFEAMSSAGARSQGNLVANSEREALSILDARGLFPLRIAPAKQEINPLQGRDNKLARQARERRERDQSTGMAVEVKHVQPAPGWLPARPAGRPVHTAGSCHFSPSSLSNEAGRKRSRPRVSGGFGPARDWAHRCRFS